MAQPESISREPGRGPELQSSETRHAAGSLRTLGAGLAFSWREHRALLTVSWVVTLILCAGAVWFGRGLYYFLDFRDGGGRWSGLFSVLSAGCFALAGFGLLIVARLSHAIVGRSDERVAWTFGGLGAVFLALDDLAQVHESLARWLARAGVPSPFGGDRDLYVFVAYAAGALYAVRGVLPVLQRWTRAWLPGIAAIACFGGSVAIDALPWEMLARPQQELWGSAEEILKTLGSVSFALFSLLLVECAARESGSPRALRPLSR